MYPFESAPTSTAGPQEDAMTGPPVRAWDSATFLDPRVETRNGHHGHAIDVALRDVLGDTYNQPRDQHRIARKKLIIGPGTLVTPSGPGARKWFVSRNLERAGDRTRNGDVSTLDGQHG
jgi:hypothetical protein